MPDGKVEVWAYLKEFAPAIFGVLLALSVATVRERGKGSSMKQALGEGFVCASLSLGVITLLEEFGLNQSYSQFVGVLIGFLGTSKLTDIAYNFLDLFIRRGK